MRKNKKQDRGDVLMEYVLLMILIVVPVVCGSKVLFDPGGENTGKSTASVRMALERKDDFGIVGNRLVDLFRRTFCGLALPVP